jgi:hypothetical protein
MSMAGQVIFEDWRCECAHSPHSHDDGFGCMEPGCPCLAQWGFA